MNDLLEQKLHALHAANQPDADFVNQLEQKLRLAHREKPAPVAVMKQNGHLRLRRRLLGIAASVVIITGLFAVIPPLRILAQNIIDFFVPSEEFTHPSNRAAFKEIVIVDTVDEAEKRAAFQALEVVDGSFKIYSIGASKDVIRIIYQKEQPNDHLITMSVFTYRTDAEVFPIPIGIEAEVKDIIVNDVSGQLVNGVWLCIAEACDEGNFEWTEGYSNTLVWETAGEGLTYQVSVSPEFAETPEEVIAIAEALE
jgi:hypothetical protein